MLFVRLRNKSGDGDGDGQIHFSVKPLQHHYAFVNVDLQRIILYTTRICGGWGVGLCRGTAVGKKRRETQR